jgi:hypothetical protein
MRKFVRGLADFIDMKMQGEEGRMIKKLRSCRVFLDKIVSENVQWLEQTCKIVSARAGVALERDGEMAGS